MASCKIQKAFLKNVEFGHSGLESSWQIFNEVVLFHGFSNSRFADQKIVLNDALKTNGAV